VTDMERYIQQMMVPEIGTEGQKKLQEAKVLIIGAGGLGVPLSTYLVTAGIGTLGIIDGDTIARSNLHRQFAYREEDVGQSKVKVLQSFLAARNSTVVTNSYDKMLDASNAKEYISQYDVICDCTDNAEARILIDKICGEENKPLVYAAVRDWQGYVTVLHHKNRVSLEDIFSSELLLSDEVAGCSVAGIVGAVCGIAGSLQATEVIKVIVGMESELDWGVMCFDVRAGVFRIFNINREVKG
jgi:molybdopterin/thiamine biosynthesis adenylyltransferase